MPGLVALGRRWEAGSDDLVIPCGAECLGRFIWLTAVVCVWATHAPHLACEGGRMLQAYLFGVVIILAVTMFLTLFLVRESAKGFIMNSQARLNVPYLIYARICLAIPEIIWNVVGTVWAFTDEMACGEDWIAIVVIRGLVVCNWVFLLLIIIGLALVFDPLGHMHLIGPAETQRAQLWEWRCRLLCCPCMGCRPDTNINDAYEDVAAVFTSFFHDLDLVPSDLACAFLLLHLRHNLTRTQQRRKGFAKNRFPITEPPDSNDVLTSSPKGTGPDRSKPINFSPSAVSVPISYLGERDDIREAGRGAAVGRTASNTIGLVYDWMNPSMAYKYMKYALASYGWMWYLYGGFLKGLYTMKANVFCCACIRERPPYITDDNCCHCNLAALKTITELSDQDIIHVSFHNNVFEVPFFVAADHETSSIVVSIRGTLSLHDALTDLAAKTENMNIQGIPEGWVAHKGILQAAWFVKRKLDESGALNRAFQLYPHYNLVITGHSLGAGAAVLLSLLLKPRFPALKCFAFSPPGGLINEEAAKATETFCLSVIVGDDLVPRLSISTLGLLKSQLISEIQSCRHPKHRILLRGCWYALRPNNVTVCEDGRALHPLLESNVGSYSYESLNDVSRQYSPHRRGPGGDQPLYLPGRIMQIEEIDPLDPLSSAEMSYEARWMQKEDYNQILVTPRMLSDHVPDTVLRVLRGLAAQYESSFTGVSVDPASLSQEV